MTTDEESEEVAYLATPGISSSISKQYKNNSYTISDNNNNTISDKKK